MRMQAVRVAVNIAAATMTVFCIFWALEAYQWLSLTFYTEQLLAMLLGLSIFIAFLRIRNDRQFNENTPWYDWILGVSGLVNFVWIASEYERLLFTAGQLPKETVVLGLMAALFLLETLRRAAGYMLFGVVVIFFVYGFLGDLVPGQLKTLPVGFSQMFSYISIDATAMLGTPLRIGGEVVVVFIFLGQLLLRTGGGEFFTDLALATMGRRRGGAAKVSVVASAMFGSISGSATSNVASTGVITIPLMQKSGYSGVQAGAIEAVASTGGSLMPPIMGAAAFLMAEYLEISYAEVVIAAIVPALLYYFAVFVQVDLLAAKGTVNKVNLDLPRTRDVLRQGWHFLLPFVVLLVALFEFWLEPQAAALWASATIILLTSIFSYKGQRLTFKALVISFWDTGKLMVELLLIVAAAGVIIGILSLTGLGFALTFALVELGGGSMFLLLLIAALICIILGLGMPTTGVYVLLASLVAPSLSEAGIVPIAAHMFIFYFGLMSLITPPVAICAFTAAAITGEDSMKTGFAAMKLAWTAYIIPFLFVLSPTLMLFGKTTEIVFDIFSVTVGVYFISVAVVGFFSNQLGIIPRVILVLAGMAAMTPSKLVNNGMLIDLGGLFLGIVLLCYISWYSKKHREK